MTSICSVRDDPALEDVRDELAPAFASIDAEWVEAMYAMETTDRAVLSNTYSYHRQGRRGAVRMPGGPGLVGARALMPNAMREFELTKMDVLAAARGRKVGEFPLAGVIAKAREMQAEGRLDIELL